MLTDSTTLWGVMIALYAVGIGTGLGVSVQLERFLRATPAIDSREALERFKTLARQNMYLALVQIPVLGGGGLIGLVLIWRHGLGALGGILALNGLLLLAGWHVGRKEKAARGLPAATAELAEEHARVSHAWLTKMLPDF